jgi:hypothetical protein
MWYWSTIDMKLPVIKQSFLVLIIIIIIIIIETFF